MSSSNWDRSKGASTVQRYITQQAQTCWSCIAHVWSRGRLVVVASMTGMVRASRRADL